MDHPNTILCQIVYLFPRHEFERLAKIYHVELNFRSFSPWSQFLAMTIAQLSSRKSLRDVVSNIGAQRQRIYHFGMRPTKRTTLARVNEQQTYLLYRDKFYKLLNRL